MTKLHVLLLIIIFWSFCWVEKKGQMIFRKQITTDILKIQYKIVFFLWLRVKDLMLHFEWSKQTNISIINQAEVKQTELSDSQSLIIVNHRRDYQLKCDNCQHRQTTSTKNFFCVVFTIVIDRDANNNFVLHIQKELKKTNKKNKLKHSFSQNHKNDVCSHPAEAVRESNTWKKNPPAQLSADCDNALLCDEASVTFLPKSLELLIII